jgi:hypothetical protein
MFLKGNNVEHKINIHLQTYRLFLTIDRSIQLQITVVHQTVRT